MRNKIIITAIFSTVMCVTLAMPASVLAEDRSPAPAEQPTLVESGTIVVEAEQVRLLIGGAKGTGILNFDGKNYNFKISGVSVGGVGVTKVNAVGIVYNLKDIKDFPGTYAGMGVGAAAVDGAGGSTWEKGDIVIKTKSELEGVGLNLGINTVTIELVD